MMRSFVVAIVGLFSASIALGLAGSAMADGVVGEVARVECDAVQDKGEAFALSFYGDCWRLRVTCEGGAAGSAVLDTGDDFDGEVDFSATGDVAEQCRIEGNSVGLDGISQYEAKCDFASGATFQVRAQPVDADRCVDRCSGS